MEDWKKQEISLLKGDIYERLLEMGVDTEKARQLSNGILPYQGEAGNPVDKLYLDQRFRRITILMGFCSSGN